MAGLFWRRRPVTGSFLAGCFNQRSDIDLVCYGQAGYAAARELFADEALVKPYTGDDLMQLYSPACTPRRSAR
jgi:predicted nucleotidyltransferase